MVKSPAVARLIRSGADLSPQSMVKAYGAVPPLKVRGQVRGSPGLAPRLAKEVVSETRGPFEGILLRKVTITVFESGLA